MNDEFTKRIDDLVRQELLILGYHYEDVVESIEQSRGSEGAIVRLRPPYDDVSFSPPPGDMPEQTFTAFIRRRLMARLEAPDRPPSSEEI